jgi:DNA-binding ferritin-like protein
METMDEAQRQAKYEAQTEELYAGLGAFVAAFEQVIHTMRQALVMALSHDGQSQQLIRPAYAELTASPLTSTFQATVARMIEFSELTDSEKEAGRKILTNVCNQIRTMTEARNEIVHGTWFIGWASESQEDFSLATGFKEKITKQGAAQTDIGRTRADFDHLVDRCQELRDLVNRIHGVLFLNRPFSTNFIWTDRFASLDKSHWTFKRRIPMT